jgi:hypothetical protein
MIDLDWIETVKEQDEGYLVNGSMSVPIAEGNRHYAAVKVWLETNTAEPMFTVEELAAQEVSKINSESRAYLASTDWYAIRSQETGVTMPDDVKILRAEAREAIV